MRTENFILILLLAIISCKPKTKQDIVKENIRQHLSKTMHDFKSYEPVQYGEIDSLYTDYFKTDRHKELKDLFYKYKKEGEDALEMAKTYLYVNRTIGKSYSEEGTDYAKKLDSLAKLITKEDSEFKPQFIGYQIAHSFRGKNMNGTTILTTENFILDSAYNVVRTEEIK